jgi:pentose-5-phosphate-3-epimerase
MAIICPSVTAYDPHEYREQIERVAPFARRLHLDFMDGVFTPQKSPELNQFWWPRKIPTDLHLMCKRPFDYIDVIENLEPPQVITHAEAEGNFIEWADRLHHISGIKVGVGLLQQTEPETIKDSLERIDYVLIFSGDLGNFGGKADLKYLDKVKKLKDWKPELEIGWDGGINEWNIGLLVDGGIGVLNVGGSIQKAKDPAHAYGTLLALAENRNGTE